MSSLAPRTDIGGQLRRRRDAALRCELLECGHVDRHRDPLSCIAEFEGPPAASFCCSSLTLGQAAWLAEAGRFCSATTCARLVAS